MMAPVQKQAMQNMFRFGNDVLIKIDYIFMFNLHVSYYKARYAM